MERRHIWLGLFIGSTIGGYLPVLWGGSTFSFSSLILGTLGALLGIWIAFRLGS